MEPTLRSALHYVLCAPVDRYVGEGLYVIEQLGYPCIYRFQSGGHGLLRQLSDNKAYQPERPMTQQEFEECMLAKVMANVITQDSRIRDFAL